DPGPRRPSPARLARTSAGSESVGLGPDPFLPRCGSAPGPRGLGKARRLTTSRGGVGLAIGGLALLLAAVNADPLFSRRNFVGRDLVAYNLPMEKTIHDAYARGHLPVWSPDISGGRPLLPNPNAGALYPVRMLLAPLSFPLAMPLFP